MIYYFDLNEKSYCCEWKKKLQKVNTYNYDNSDNSNVESKPRFFKFISFLLLINQDVPNNLQLQLLW